MSVYLLVETRSRWESGEVDGFLDLAKGLASAGERVDLVLIQNAVLISRDRATVADLTRTSIATIWADDVSLALRGIAADHLPNGIRVAEMKRIVGLMTRPDCKTVWH
jgi:sulfur transfer complex TusBCD TusB component (DsrH family)